MKFLLLPFLLLANAVCVAQVTGTGLLAPLRSEHTKTSELISEVLDHFNSGSKDTAKLHKLGDKIADRMAANRRILARYDSTTTRFGLQEEYNHVTAIMYQCRILTLAYGRMTGVPPRAPTEREQNEARETIKRILKSNMRNLIIQKLASQGLADLLTAESFEDVVDQADEKITARILSKLDSDIVFLVKFGVAGGSLKDLAVESARLMTARYVTSLIMKWTSNTLVVEFFAGPIIRWVGETLRRAFRPTGNLDARTERSVTVLREATRNLHKLDGRAAMYGVRLALKEADDAAASTKYLVSDIIRAKREDLGGRMYDAIDDLERAIRLTNRRFLIDSKMASLDLREYMRELDDHIGQIRNMQENIEPAAPETARAPATAEEGDDVSGFYEVLNASGGTKPYTQQLTLYGSISNLNFDYTILDQGTTKWRWKGYVSSKGAQTGAYRTLTGNGINQMPNGSRVEKAVITLHRGSDGIWRVERFTFAGNVNTLRKWRGT